MSQSWDRESMARDAAHDLFNNIWHDRYDFTSGDLANTPIRFVRALMELTTPKEFDFTVFASDTDEMIVVGDIPFVTLCAHHVLPFTGKAWVGYVPDGKIAGLSKLARAVQAWSAGLNVQEDLTRLVADTLEEILEPRGVAVVMRAEHTCMTLRGAQAVGSLTTTSVMRGVYADHDRLARNEFFRLAGI